MEFNYDSRVNIVFERLYYNTLYDFYVVNSDMYYPIQFIDSRYKLKFFNLDNNVVECSVSNIFKTEDNFYKVCNANRMYRIMLLELYGRRTAEEVYLSLKRLYKSKESFEWLYLSRGTIVLTEMFMFEPYNVTLRSLPLCNVYSEEQVRQLCNSYDKYRYIADIRNSLKSTRN